MVYNYVIVTLTVSLLSGPVLLYDFPAPTSVRIGGTDDMLSVSVVFSESIQSCSCKSTAYPRLIVVHSSAANIVMALWDILFARMSAYELSSTFI